MRFTSDAGSDRSQSGRDAVMKIVRVEAWPVTLHAAPSAQTARRFFRRAFDFAFRSEGRSLPNASRMAPRRPLPHASHAASKECANGQEPASGASGGRACPDLTSAPSFRSSRRTEVQTGFTTDARGPFSRSFLRWLCSSLSSTSYSTAWPSLRSSKAASTIAD